MGVRIAWTFAALRPGRTDKLVLISPDGFAGPDMEYGIAPNVPLMMRALPYVLPTSMLRASLAPACANAATITDALFARYRDMMLAPGVRRVILSRMGQQRLVDPIPQLRLIAVPTLVMWSERMVSFRSQTRRITGACYRTAILRPCRELGTSHRRKRRPRSEP